MLTKLPHSQYIPAVQGVVAQPERTVCTPVVPPGPRPPKGYWKTECKTVQILIGNWTREDAEWGRCRYDQIGTPQYIAQTVCNTIWVRT